MNNPAKRVSRKELLQILERECQAKTAAREARLLAPELMFRVGINPQGIDLICWLADSRCRSNQEAVVRWIENERGKSDFMEEAAYRAERDLLNERLFRALSKSGAANT